MYRLVWIRNDRTMKYQRAKSSCDNFSSSDFDRILMKTRKTAEAPGGNIEVILSNRAIYPEDIETK